MKRTVSSQKVRDILLPTNDSGGLEGEGEEVGEGEPVPVLGEHQHAHHSQHVRVARPAHHIPFYLSKI